MSDDQIIEKSAEEVVSENTTEVKTPSVEELAAEATEVEPAQAAEEGAPEDQGTPVDHPDMKWYIVNSQSMYEHKARLSLLDRIKRMNQAEHFGQILIPTENVVELVKGKKRSTERKFFPGYMLVQMKLTDQTWHTVTGTLRISGFVGNGKIPSPLPLTEVKRLTKQMQSGAAAARPKFSFTEGDSIKVIDGPFSNFNGTVEEVNNSKNTLKVLVSIFGRATPVDLEFIQVKKL